MNDHDEIDENEDNKGSNVIDFSHVKKIKEIQEAQEKKWREDYRQQRKQAHPYAQSTVNKKEPMLNLPPATKSLAALFIAVHIIVHFILNPDQYNWVLTNLAFTPAAYTTDLLNIPLWAKLVSPLTYMMLHGNFMHLGMNTIMLLAFGTGLERFIGAKRFLIFFIACGMAALIIHFIVNFNTPNPLIGASGSLSGLFAGMLLILHARGLIGTGKYGLWPIIALWTGITIMFGVFASPGSITSGGEAHIAWLAHLGGFLAGFVLLKPILKLKI